MTVEIGSVVRNPKQGDIHELILMRYDSEKSNGKLHVTGYYAARMDNGNLVVEKISKNRGTIALNFKSSRTEINSLPSDVYTGLVALLQKQELNPGYIVNGSLGPKLEEYLKAYSDN
jgi:hypothetical protein